MIVVTPDDTPVTRPDDEITDAIVGDAELHTPPEIASLNKVAAPVQTKVVPVMTAGEGSTVTVLVL